MKKGAIEGSVERYERMMRPHGRGASVLGELALAFEAHPREQEQQTWTVMLGVIRGVGEAALKDGFYAGDCLKALLKGESYGEDLPTELATDFKLVHDSLTVVDAVQRERLENIPHEVAYYVAKIKTHKLSYDDVTSPHVDEHRKITDFQASLEEYATFRAELFALPMIDGIGRSVRAENDARGAYNLWLNDFFIAYEHIGALVNGHEDVKKGRHNVEEIHAHHFSQSRVAMRSLMRCVLRGRPRATSTLIVHGTSRAARKIANRLYPHV